MTDLETEIQQHCEANYSRRLAARLKKLGEELGELAEAVAIGTRTDVLEEAADMGIVLADLVAILGGSLTEEMEKKLEIVKRRAESVGSSGRLL